MRTFFGLTAVIVLNISIAHGSAQGPPNRIPSNQSPISKVFAPSSAEQTKPGTGKFVIFTREQIGKDWDFMAGAWECIPSRPEVPVTKRVEFCHASWSARPLIGPFCNVGNGSHPNFVMLQVNKGETDFEVNLYEIDYRTWNVRCLWQGHRLEAYGVLGESLFCRRGENWLVLDIPSRTVNKNIPFTPLHIYGDRALVKKTGEETGAWSYDAKKSEYLGRFRILDESKLKVIGSQLSSDGKTRACLAIQRGQNQEDGWTKGRLIVQQQGSAEDQPVAVEFLFSEKYSFANGVLIHFPSKNQVEFRATKEFNIPETHVWQVDLPTKKVSKKVQPDVELGMMGISDHPRVPRPGRTRH